MPIQKRIQLKSNNAVKGWEWMFPTDVTLYTTEMPGMEKYDFDLGYKFETCVFRSDDGSDVLERYDTYEEAKEGHMRLTEELGLSFVNEFFISDARRITNE
jgi:hypothetical protein